jgi:hypothetical protein
VHDVENWVGEAHSPAEVTMAAAAGRAGRDTKEVVRRHLAAAFDQVEGLRRERGGRYAHAIDLIPADAWRRWKNFGPALVEHFRRAMRSTNPAFGGMWDNGPVPRFIAAVVPLVTGEQPTPRSVAAQLKTSKKTDD